MNLTLRMRVLCGTFAVCPKTLTEWRTANAELNAAGPPP